MRWLLVKKEVGSEQALTNAAKVLIGGTLSLGNYQRLEILGSQVRCQAFQGNRPEAAALKNFTPYTTGSQSYVSGYSERRRHRLHSTTGGDPIYSNRAIRVNGVPIPMVFTIGSEFNEEMSAFDISGILSAVRIDIRGIQYGRHGQFEVWVNLAYIPSRPFRQRVSFLDYFQPTAAYEMSEVGETVFQSVVDVLAPPGRARELPLLRAVPPVMPSVVLGPDGALTAPAPGLRRLFTPEQEQNLLMKIIMGELGRGFLHQGLTDAAGMLQALKGNAVRYARESRRICTADPAHPLKLLDYSSGAVDYTVAVRSNSAQAYDLEEPCIVDEVITCEREGRTEEMLVPTVYFPKSFDNPRVRSAAGCLLSLDGITLQGEPGSQLHLRGNLDTQGLAVIRDFEVVSRVRNTYTTYQTVTHETTQKSTLGKNKTTKTCEQVALTHLQSDSNAVHASGMVVSNVKHLYLAGTEDRLGKDGLRVYVETIIDQAIMQLCIGERVSKKQKGLLGIGGSTTISQPISQHAAGSKIISDGPVHIRALFAQFDATEFTLPPDAKVEFEVTELHFHELLRAMEAHNAAMAAELREAERTAKRKKKQGLIRLIISLPVAAYCGGLAVGWLQSFGAGAAALGAAGAVKVTFAQAIAQGIVQGAVSGGVRAAITGGKIGRGVFQGAVLGGVDRGVGHHLENVAALKGNLAIIRGLQAAATSGVSTTLNHGHNLIENMVIAGVAAGVAEHVFPCAPGETLPIMDAVLKAALDSTLSTTLQGGTAEDLVTNAAVAGFGTAVQTPLSALGKSHGGAVGIALQSRLSSSAGDVREAIALEGPQFAPPSNAGKTSHQEMGLTSNAGSSSRSDASAPKGSGNARVRRTAARTLKNSKHRGRDSWLRVREYGEERSHRQFAQWQEAMAYHQARGRHASQQESMSQDGVLSEASSQRALTRGRVRPQTNEPRFGFDYAVAKALIGVMNMLVPEARAESIDAHTEADRAVPEVSRHIFGRVLDNTGRILRESGARRELDQTFDLLGKMFGAFTGYVSRIPERGVRDLFGISNSGETPITNDVCNVLQSVVHRHLEMNSQGFGMLIRPIAEHSDATSDQLMAIRTMLEFGMPFFGRLTRAPATLVETPSALHQMGRKGSPISSVNESLGNNRGIGQQPLGMTRASFGGANPPALLMSWEHFKARGASGETVSQILSTQRVVKIPQNVPVPQAGVPASASHGHGLLSPDFSVVGTAGNLQVAPGSQSLWLAWNKVQASANESAGVRFGTNQSNIARFEVLFDRASKKEVRDFLKGPEVSKYMNEMQQTSVRQVLSSGAAQEVTLKIVKQNNHVRVLMERAGHTNGGQKMLFEIFQDGEKGKILQTAHDDFGKFVEQKPGQSKNNIFDVKKWKKP